MTGRRVGGWIRFSALTALLVVLPCAAALAQDEAGPTPRYRYAWSFAIGPFEGEEDFGLLEGASGGALITIGFGHRLGRLFHGEAELGFAGREHDTPTLPLLDDPRVTIAWLAYSVAARFPVGRFEPFVAVGIGSGQADVEIGDYIPYEQLPYSLADDRGVLFLYRAGFDVALSPKNRIGLEVRGVDMEADLGAYSGGDADIGGTAVLFTYRRVFSFRVPPMKPTS